MKKLFLIAVILLPLFLLLQGNRDKDNSVQLWQALDKEGDRLFQNHQIENACRYWQKVIKENPANPKAYNKLGISFMLLKENEKAIGILERGLDIDSDNPGLNYNLALACYYSGDNEKSLEQCEKVLNLNSDYPEAHYLKGLCLENMGDPEEAKRAYIEELNSNPGSPRAWKKIKREL